MYSPYYKKRGVEDLYGKVENVSEPKKTPAVKKEEPKMKKGGLFDGIGSFFGNLRDDDLIIALVFLTVLNEHNDEDYAILIILALLFFT